MFNKLIDDVKLNIIHMNYWKLNVYAKWIFIHYLHRKWKLKPNNTVNLNNFMLINIIKMCHNKWSLSVESVTTYYTYIWAERWKIPKGHTWVQLRTQTGREAGHGTFELCLQEQNSKRFPLEHTHTTPAHSSCHDRGRSLLQLCVFSNLLYESVPIFWFIKIEIIFCFVSLVNKHFIFLS